MRAYSGAGVPPEVVARVRALVERGCGLCQNAMRAEGIKVLALMSCDVARMGTISCHVEAAKWDRILDVRALPRPSAAFPVVALL